MKYSELAAKYHTTIARIRKEQYDFVQSEGFLPDGREAQNLIEWLDMRLTKQGPLDNQDPFQKGDRDYGL